MIHDKLIAVQSALKAPKNQTNSFGGYKYRSCEDILTAVKPLLAEQGLCLTLSDKIEEIGGRVYVRAMATLVSAEDIGDRQYEQLTVCGYAREEDEKKGMDSSQITGAASSYARKYALNGLFCIDDTKDSDYTNTGTKEPVKAKSAEESKVTMAENPKPEKKYTCSLCFKDITKAEAEYSWKKYNRILCRDCQKKV